MIAATLVTEPKALSPSVVKEVSLYYTDPAKNSDKVYTLRIVRGNIPSIYQVQYEHGKRGKKMQGGVKINGVSATEAERTFNEVMLEKKREGYTTNISGVPFSK